MQFWPKKNKGKDFPQFWRKYTSLFDKKDKSSTVYDTRFVVFDTETTGFDYIHDRVLSIGAVAITKSVIDVADQIEVYLEQEVFNSDTVKIHGIRKNNSFNTITEKEALELFIAYIGNAVLIAHHAEFDRKMINTALKRHGLGVLKNQILDTAVLYRKTKHLVYQNDIVNQQYSLDALCDQLKISKSDRHTASGDAFITALAFLKIVIKLGKNTEILTKDLFR